MSTKAKSNYDTIKKALLEVFSTNPFQAYESFSRRVWPDEPVDIYSTDLLFAVAGGAAQGGAVLPTCRGNAIGGRGQLGYLQVKVYAKGDSVENNQRSGRCCYCCGGPHLIRFCRSKAKQSCWACGDEGHISSNCPKGQSGQGKYRGTTCAPEGLPGTAYRYYLLSMHLWRGEVSELSATQGAHTQC
ncbi:hypothetical protein SK128_008160 [Halocaridina rubra]|uniref:CCHC-type domain-containing protein n=1 Tax=Halocaridina rubra TaxID=373956 RepID=A0AAN8XNT9_HALRR